jgi:hypothetical protein
MITKPEVPEVLHRNAADVAAAGIEAFQAKDPSNYLQHYLVCAPNCD